MHDAGHTCPVPVPKRTYSPRASTMKRRPRKRASSASSCSSITSPTTSTGCMSSRDAKTAIRCPSVRSSSMA